MASATWLNSNELVYEGGKRASKLIWETNAPSLTASLKADDINGWTFSANAVVGFSGNSQMVDYDWSEPSYDAADWSDRSIHTDTHLDRYINLDIAVGRDFVINDDTTINLQGGFKFTDVKRSAYGGSYIYSEYSSEAIAASGRTAPLALITNSATWAFSLVRKRPRNSAIGLSRV